MIRPRTRPGVGSGGRAQTGLHALAVALLALTVVTGVGLAVASGSLAGADRDASERRTATSLSSGLVAESSPLTDRANVLNASEVTALDADGLASAFPVAETVRGVRLELNDTTLAATGDLDGGTTVRRLVLVERRDTRTLTPSFDRHRSVTLPRRAGGATVTVQPGTDVTRVRANDRVVLRNASGLTGTFTVELSRYETTTLEFGGSGPIADGDVTVEYEPATTVKARLGVTVDA